MAAIVGKDSMSGSFLDLDVPPTLVSFAIAPAEARDVISAEFKAAGHPVYLFQAPEGDYEGTKAVWRRFHDLCQAGKVCAAWAVSTGGVAEGIMKMSFGNQLGFVGEADLQGDLLFAPLRGSIVAELSEDVDFGRRIGKTQYSPMLEVGARSSPSTISAISGSRRWRRSTPPLPTRRRRTATWWTSSARSGPVRPRR